MATSQTEHYKLSQWVPSDPVVRADFNADNAAIDAALHELETEKASREDLASQMKGTAKISYGYYSGSGTSGSFGAQSLSFSFGRPPQLVVVRPERGGGSALVLVNGITTTQADLGGSTINLVTVSWSADGVRWYADTAEAMLNTDGVKYYFFAIG